MMRAMHQVDLSCDCEESWAGAVWHKLHVKDCPMGGIAQAIESECEK